MSDPLILTAWLDAGTEAWLEALRRAHFPPALNRVPAHVTLFHALPGAEVAAISAALAEIAREEAPASARFGVARFTGRGVALPLEAPGLAAVRGRLAARWAPWLEAQDRQGWRAHATVMNKAAPEAARAVQARLLAELPPREATVLGLRLWWYRGGPWEAAGAVRFEATR